MGYDMATMVNAVHSCKGSTNSRTENVVQLLYFWGKWLKASNQQGSQVHLEGVFMFLF